MKWLPAYLRPLLIPALAIALAAAINTFWLINAYVPSESMEPNIPKKSMALGLRTAYNAELPQTGDVIFFRHEELGNNLLVKRVVALPGQTVAIEAGRVYIDGDILEEPYIEEFSQDNFGLLRVPKDCYFVLGDNRLLSRDSRYWDEPYVHREEIVGKAVWVWFPQFNKLN